MVLKAEGLGFRGLGFGGLGFRGSGFRGLGFRILVFFLGISAVLQSTRQVSQLEKAGRMQPSGRAKIEQAKKEGRGCGYYGVSANRGP